MSDKPKNEVTPGDLPAALDWAYACNAMSGDKTMSDYALDTLAAAVRDLQTQCAQLEYLRKEDRAMYTKENNVLREYIARLEDE